jgi:hypothetical protein
MSKLYICIRKDGVLLEKYTFQVISMMDDLKSISIDEIESALRTFLLKISCLDSTLESLSDCCQWDCYLEIKSEDPCPTVQGMLVEADANNIRVSDARIMPIRTVNTGLLKLEMFVEDKINCSNKS